MSKKKTYYKGKTYEEAYTGGRFSNEELSLISNTFLDNLELLMALRKHFLQGNMLAIEVIDLDKLAANQETMAVLRKMLLPEIDPEVPLFQTADMWISIDTQFKEMDLGQSLIMMKARQLVIDYMEQQFAELKDRNTARRIKLKDLKYSPKKKPEQAYIEMSARNYLLTFIDRHLQELMILAVQNKTPESEAEAEKRNKDSNK